MTTICVKYRSEKSQNGYSLDTLKSALQKYIRRGNANMACYIAREFLSFYFVTEGEDLEKNITRIMTNFTHRLQIIILEDIGCASLPYLPQFDALLTLLKSQLKQTPFLIDDCLDTCIRYITLGCNCIKAREGNQWRSFWRSLEGREQAIKNKQLLEIKNV